MRIFVRDQGEAESHPQAYPRMSRTWDEDSTPISGEKTFLR